jgi:hypothetical protein
MNFDVISSNHDSTSLVAVISRVKPLTLLDVFDSPSSFGLDIEHSL